MMRLITLDSMPAARLAVLRALAADDGQTTADAPMYVAAREVTTALGAIVTSVARSSTWTCTPTPDAGLGP